MLVKMRGSVFGIGTDVGGSVRIPAMCNGIIGFKPSSGRVPRGGQQSGQLPEAAKVGLESAVGVIARAWDDVDLCLTAVEAAKSWQVDQEIIPGKWWKEMEAHEGKEKRTIIGVMWRDGVTEPLPPVRRAIEEVVQKLRARNIEVVDINARRFKDCQSLANKFFSTEGGNYLIDRIEESGEPLIPWLAPRFKRKKPASLDTFRDLNAQRIQLQNDFLSIWKTRDDRQETIDAIICPVAPHPVPGIDKWNTMSYTSSFVLLDYPAASLPVRTVNAKDLKEEMTGDVIGPWDRINRELCEHAHTEAKYLRNPC